jgi:trehalose 6-phosphate phosphorylase
MRTSDWIIAYDKPETGKLSFEQESLMALGNGYLNWQSAPVWSQFSEAHHPGLSLAAGKFHFVARINDEDVAVLDEDRLNLPNPQLMRFIVNGSLISFEQESIVDRKSFIDFEHGVQSDRYTVRVTDGFVSLTTTKYLDPINFHAFGFEGTFSTTFAGDLVIESVIEADGAEDLNVVSISDHLLLAKSTSMDAEIAVAAKTFVNGKLIEQSESDKADSQLIERRQLSFSANETIKFEKVIDIATSLELNNPGLVARRNVDSLPLASIKANNAKYWKALWAEADIRLDSDDPDLQRLIRMSIFHIRQAAQHNANQYLDTTVYENSLLPYYCVNSPETARDLLKFWITHSDQLPISLAVVYNIWYYVQVTADVSLLNEGGLELVLNAIKRWLQWAKLDETGRYHFGSSVYDNVYDSLKLIWLLNWLFTLPSMQGLKLLEIAKKTGFDDKHFYRAQDISKKLYLNISDASLSGYCSFRSDLRLAGIGTASVDEIELLKLLKTALESTSLECTDSEGKQLGLMADAIEVIINRFAGVDIRQGEFSIAPKLPHSWHQLVFRQKIRNVKIKIEISERLIILTADKNVTVKVYGNPVKLKAGILSTFALKK